MPQPFMQHMQHQPFQQNAGTVGGHQAAADAQAHAQAAWASANFGYLWNPPQWGVPSSMALFVPAPLQYAGQLMPQASHPHSQVQIITAVVLALILLLYSYSLWTCLASQIGCCASLSLLCILIHRLSRVVMILSAISTCRGWLLCQCCRFACPLG